MSADLPQVAVMNIAARDIGHRFGFLIWLGRFTGVRGKNAQLTKIIEK
jgi:hypothetical protein